MKSYVLIGAASSGCGKTTFTLGLLRALKNRSYRVQPFKCGPDYIDTRHHRMAAGCASINLDRFMMSETHIRRLYGQYALPSDVAVTEGVMGVFDGYDRMRGSSAEIAQMLDIPIVLIVNAQSVAYSVAPLVYGFKHFNRQVRLAGVVFNRVASESHYAFLKEACEDVGVEALGYLPKCKEIEIPGRHLGLSLDDDFCFEEFADRIASLVERHVNIDRLLEVTSFDSMQQAYREVPSSGREEEGNGNRMEGAEKEKETSFQTNDAAPKRIAIARDAAFNFVYEENVRWLERRGEVSYFSPLQDASLPEEVDFVYLPGGYPELYLSQLSGNERMKQSIRTYVERGGKLLAECGGMMYLCKEIIDTDGTPYPMTGLLQQSATMQNMKLRLGYRHLHTGKDTIYGHEFHYSRILSQENPLPSIAKAYTAKDISTETPLYRYKNVLAGYTHLYWGDDSRNAWFVRFLNEASK